METQRLFLDADVVINWLIQETETASGKPLWEAPYKIINLIENKAVTGIISITTLMEIRYLLRRKKSYTSQQVEDDISKLTSIFEVIIPDEINLLKANSLQAEHHLDPFDAIQLSLVTGLTPVILVSRDREFIQIAKQFITALTPEEFL
ncbi:MAG: PIN domain-containing protein [Candidatus Omnitrophica bacterium]|nr:PIN domain-containing protein [Candidatus Omnitrophota bacterium]